MGSRCQIIYEIVFSEIRQPVKIEYKAGLTLTVLVGQHKMHLLRKVDRPAGLRIAGKVFNVSTPQSSGCLIFVTVGVHRIVIIHLLDNVKCCWMLGMGAGQ